jgi:ABC-2 type transport system ATP-binding protein
VRRLTERILVVDHGRLAFDGTLAQLVEQVGAERNVVLDLTDPAPPLDGIPGTRLVDLEGDGLRQRLSFGPGETTVAAILAAVAQHGVQVHDLTIEEPDIEAVVRRLYSG